MNRKVCVVFVIYFLMTVTTGLISCCGPFPDKFKVISIEWRTYKVTLTSDNISFSEISNIVAFNELGIYLKPKIQSFYSHLKRNNNFITGLYACSENVLTTNDRITNIRITADKNFSNDYPSGDDLSDLFDIVIKDLSYNKVIERFDLREYIQTTPIVPSEMTLILKNAPDTIDEYQFTIQYFQEGVDLHYAEFTSNKIMIFN
jgi:hypothetical protein